MIGDRIRQARLAAGLTLGEVAERLAAAGRNITRQGLSKYERNKSTPGADFLLKLGRVLGVKPPYFLSDPEITIQWLAFRKHSRLGKRRQDRVKALALTIVEGQIWLQMTLYPDERPSFPRLPTRTLDNAEEAACTLRSEWNLGNRPIESVTETVEDRGGVVVLSEESDAEFDGLCGFANQDFPVVVVSSLVPDDRRRYDIAHELGHLVMDCEDLPPKEQENLAHRFAAALLVPEVAARQELGTKRRRLTFEELGLLKRKYGLSMQAWARRAFDLGIIEEGHYRSLCVEFSARKWRKEEPVSFEGREKPMRLRQMVHRALAEGIITPEKAQELRPHGGEALDILPQGPAPTRVSAIELMKLPRKEREEIMAMAAALADKEYRSNSALTDFEAFGGDDLYDGTEEG